MAGIFLVILAGQDNDLHVRGVRQQIPDQGEPFVGAMGQRRQAEVDECSLWPAAQLFKERQAMGTGVAGDDVEVGSEGMCERVPDQRVVVDDQEQGLAGQGVAGRERCAAL
jgi:hypothetical protein